MPLPLEQSCQVLLTAISQSVGQVNGTAFGCERWNVPALKNLQDQLQALTRGSGCRKAFTDQLASVELTDAEATIEGMFAAAAVGPLDLMLATVQGVLEEYGLTDAGFEQLAQATVTREEARDIIVLQLQTDWLDVVKQLTDMYGSSRQASFDGIWPGEIPPLFDEDTQRPSPEAVWPIRSDQVQCLIDAGGGLVVKDPKTGEILTNGEAQERLHWQYSDLTGYFEWREDSPGAALFNVLSVVESAVTFAFGLQWDSEEYGISSAEIDRRTAEAYANMYAGLTDTGTDSDRRDVLRDLGFDVDAWYELPDHIIEAAEAKIAPMLSMLPRRIRDVKQLMDLEDKAKQRRDGLISDDDKLKAAIMAAEEIAIEKGQASGDCPPTPDAWLDHRSDAVEAAYARGLDAAGTDKLIKDPRTGEMISENEALFRLNYEPQETGPAIFPDDPTWFSYVDRQSTEAQDVEDATVNLQDIMYVIDNHVRMGDMAFDEMDEEVREKYELFWRNHVNPMAERTLHGELYGDMGGRIYSTLVKRNVLPRRVRTYASLKGLVDKMDSIRAELEKEDFEMLKAIMEGEERLLALGTGQTPSARGRVPTAEEKAKMVQEYADGGRARVIAKRYGVSHQGVLNWVREAGVGVRQIRGQQTPPEVKKEAIEAYTDHRDLGVLEIAEMHQITAPTLYAWLREAGITIRRGHGNRSQGATPEFKAEVIEAYKENLDITPTEIAQIYDIHFVSLYNWLREAGEPTGRPRGRPFVSGQTPDSHVDMSGCTFEVPDEYHDMIRVGTVYTGGLVGSCSLKVDIGGVAVYLSHAEARNVFNVSLDRRTGKPTFGIWPQLQQFIFALQDANPGSAFSVLATDDLRARVYERMGFQIEEPTDETGKTLKRGKAEAVSLTLPPMSEGGRLPSAFPYSHVDLSQVTFSVPEGFHDEIRGGYWSPQGADLGSFMWVDIAGIRMQLEHNHMANTFNINLLRETGEPTLASLQILKRFVLGLRDANPGSSQNICASDAKRARVYSRVGFETDPALHPSIDPKTGMPIQAESAYVCMILRPAGTSPGAYDPELVDRINANIDRLVSYGVRTEIATVYPTYTLSWSNASASWGIYARIHKKGEQVTLDANQLLVQAARPAIEEALPLLHMLPLFSLSYEYRHRPPTQEEDDIPPGADVQAEFPSEEPIREITGEERQRLLAEYASKADELRAQWQRELGREIGYMDQDMWDIIMPKESIYQWMLPYPRGDYPQTPLLREGPKSIYYRPGWVKIRAYQMKNPNLTVAQIAKDVGFGSSHVSHALRREPRLHAFRSERTRKQIQTMVERYGVEGAGSDVVAELHSPEFRAEVVQAYKDHPDFEINDIAKMYNMDRATVLQWVQDAGVERTRLATPPEVIAEAVKAYQDNPELDVNDIAATYKVDSDTVRRWLRFAGVEGRAMGFQHTPQFRDKVVQDYVKRLDLTVDEVAEMHGLTRNTVRYWADVAGVPRRRGHYGTDTPSAELGVFYTPEHYDPNIQEYRFYEYGPLDEDDSPYIDAYEHQGTEVSGEGELLDDEVYHHEDMGKAELLSGETYKSHAVWDIDDVKVEIDYGPWTSRLGERIDHAAWVSIERYGGAPFDNSMFLPGGPIAKVTDLLDRVHRSNPNIRIVATATRDPQIIDPETKEIISEGRGDIRAKVYERYGWRRISGTDASGGVDMELPHPDQRTPRTPTAFDGIAAYAGAIMELV